MDADSSEEPTGTSVFPGAEPGASGTGSELTGKIIIRLIDEDIGTNGEFRFLSQSIFRVYIAQEQVDVIPVDGVAIDSLAVGNVPLEEDDW